MVWAICSLINDSSWSSAADVYGETVAQQVKQRQRIPHVADWANHMSLTSTFAASSIETFSMLMYCAVTALASFIPAIWMLFWSMPNWRATFFTAIKVSQLRLTKTHSRCVDVQVCILKRFFGVGPVDLGFGAIHKNLFNPKIISRPANFAADTQGFGRVNFDAKQPVNIRNRHSIAYSSLSLPVNRSIIADGAGPIPKQVTEPSGISVKPRSIIRA